MDAVAALTQSVSRDSGPGSAGFSTLTSEDFTRIMFSELSRQDPMQPNDTNALLQQISSIRAIQSDMDLTANLKAMVSQNEFANAATLIGKAVSGATDDFRRVTGTVKGVSRTAKGAIVTLQDGSRIPLSGLDQITTPSGG